jgi:hypothetical protein
MTTTELSSELAAALDMLLSLATDDRTRLPKGELYDRRGYNPEKAASFFATY